MFPDPEDSTGRYVADLRAVLRSNPKLHVAGPRVCDECRQNGCFRKLQCASCWVDGRQVPVRRRDYPGSSVGLFGLYSHDSDEPCDLHTGRRVWAKLEEPHEDGQL
ncbi:uncharacterized protein LOC117646380 [Thrips palmi]|uniref:Uncharacterized protein LOC117646380 n=1 Tax=Thrips palmi TaxID=161013 RepID=A0A6P8Z0L7_THRPL|nr:uncharacterized protein LOC117646380 [Thrips palmi]